MKYSGRIEGNTTQLPVFSMTLDLVRGRVDPTDPTEGCALLPLRGHWVSISSAGGCLLAVGCHSSESHGVYVLM